MRPGGAARPPGRGRRRAGAGLAALFALVLPAGRAAADHDPVPRANLEVGVEGPLRGNGPVSGYGFFLWNRPHFPQDDQYLQVVVAPTYLTSELIRDRWPTTGHAFGVGGSGGAFQHDFEEFRRGRHESRESFWGHGAEATLSYYPQLKIADGVPVEGQVRLRPQHVVYQGSGDTDPRFRPPADTAIYSGRTGVRVGGVPPELQPAIALELSLWHEASYRSSAEPYGFSERPQTLQHLSQQSWGRLGGAFPVGETQTARLFVTAGTTVGADALTVFRLGGALPLRNEFPLVLHGYYVDEVFARQFWLANVSYRFPLWPQSERLHLQLAADYAQVAYLRGHELPRRSLRGLGADLSIALTPRLKVILGYGYGVDAPRDAHFGGHEANMLVEVKF